MDNGGLREKDRAPSAMETAAEIHVLHVHEIPLIEQSGSAQRGAAEHHETPGDERHVDYAVIRETVHLVACYAFAGQPFGQCAAAEQVGRRREQAAEPLDFAGGVDGLRHKGGYVRMAVHERHDGVEDAAAESDVAVHHEVVFRPAFERAANGDIVRRTIAHVFAVVDVYCAKVGETAVIMRGVVHYVYFAYMAVLAECADTSPYLVKGRAVGYYGNVDFSAHLPVFNACSAASRALRIT